MDATKLKVWLPFDESTTADKCGNSWTATGSPTISNGALQFSANNQYLSMDGGITLGGKDFTIRGKFNMSSSSEGHCRIFSLHNAASTTTGCINLARSSSNASLYSDCMGSSSSNF
ncbi:MAG: hypothetical protein IKP64_04380, partial [Selenomonadaceae bacterium]|nr:hypothetical protein [Selenomonadaceae bacterium]